MMATGVVQERRSLRDRPHRHRRPLSSGLPVSDPRFGPHHRSRPTPGRQLHPPSRVLLDQTTPDRTINATRSTPRIRCNVAADNGLPRAVGIRINAANMA